MKNGAGCGANSVENLNVQGSATFLQILGSSLLAPRPASFFARSVVDLAFELELCNCWYRDASVHRERRQMRRQQRRKRPCPRICKKNQELKRTTENLQATDSSRRFLVVLAGSWARPLSALLAPRPAPFFARTVVELVLELLRGANFGTATSLCVKSGARCGASSAENGHVQESARTSTN